MIVFSRWKEKKQCVLENKLAIVVGSGGLKPFSIGPVFELLQEHNVEPELTIACSGGALQTAFWAMGLNAQQMLTKSREFTDIFLQTKGLSKINLRAFLGLADYPFGSNSPTQGLLNAEAVLELFQQAYGDVLIEELPRKIIFQATDMESGEGVVIEQGKLYEAVYATTAVYPMLPPIKINEQWLVDGAFYNALPVFEAVQRNYKRILAISFSEPPSQYPKNFLDHYLSFIGNTLIERTKLQLPLAIDMHHGEILHLEYMFDYNYTIWDLAHLDKIIDFGYKQVEKHREEILRLVLDE